MYLLRLFDRADPGQPIAAHMLSDGITRIGRDPGADWTIPDPDCAISRHHLEIRCEDGALALRPLGANGVFRSEDGERLPDQGDVFLALGDAIDFGPYRMVVDSVPFATKSGASFDRTMVFAAPFGEQCEVPQDWADSSELPAAADEGSLLEAFCEGAKLHVSALSGEEPAEIMRRAGAIYRQMVLCSAWETWSASAVPPRRTSASIALRLAPRTTTRSNGRRRNVSPSSFWRAGKPASCKGRRRSRHRSRM